VSTHDQHAKAQDDLTRARQRSSDFRGHSAPRPRWLRLPWGGDEGSTRLDEGPETRRPVTLASRPNAASPLPQGASLLPTSELRSCTPSPRSCRCRPCSSRRGVDPSCAPPRAVPVNARQQHAWVGCPSQSLYACVMSTAGAVDHERSRSNGAGRKLSAERSEPRRGASPSGATAWLRRASAKR
jgi:hypothetical protein